MSAVVASSPDVTRHFGSYVIFVFVAPVIAPLAVTLVPTSVSHASHPDGTARPFLRVLESVPFH